MSKIILINEMGFQKWEILILFSWIKNKFTLQAAMKAQMEKGGKALLFH